MSGVDSLVMFVVLVFGELFLYLGGMFLAALLAFFIIGLAVDAISGGDRVVDDRRER
jgi:hypothetical protein